VSYAAGQLPDSFHLLGLAECFLRLKTLSDLLRHPMLESFIEPFQLLIELVRAAQRLREFVSFVPHVGPRPVQ